MDEPEYHTKEADQHKKNTEETLNTPKTGTTDSTKLPHLTNTNTILYWLRKTDTNNSKTDVEDSDSRFTHGVEVVNHTRRPLFTPRKFFDTHFW
jgi:hypothetical protein